MSNVRADGKRATRLACAKAVAAVSAVFCATVAVLMISTAIREHISTPLDMPELKALKALVREQPQNAALREQVRNLDLLARKAHFAGITALRNGAVLLLAGLAVFLGAFQAVRVLNSRIEPPAGPEPDAGDQDRSRWAVAATAVLLAVAAAGLPAFWRLPGTRPAGSEPGSPPRPPKVLESPWPAFRGPGGLGVVQDAEPPLDWDGTAVRNIRWRTPVPRPGFSSPIILGDRIFLTGGDADLRELYCFHADTGELLWRHPTAGIEGGPETPPEVTQDTGYAAPTPTTDGHRVFAIFATGNLLAVTPDGKREWARNFGVPENPYGHASSLLVYENLLLVQFDDQVGGRLLAVDTATGNVVWSVERDLEVSWASPILVKTERGPEIILNGNPDVVAYDPRGGSERWRMTCMSGEVAVSPAWWNEWIFAANQYARLVAIRVNGEARIEWDREDDLPDVSSPVAWNGMVFVADAYGTLTCLDAATGSVHWQEAFDGGFYSSPVVAAGRVYVIDLDGVTHIVEATPEACRLLARCDLGEAVSATPAFAGRRIYVRGENNLFAVEEP